MQLLRYLREAGDAEAALAHSFVRLEKAPNQPRYLLMHASLLVSAHRFDDAIRVYEAVWRQHPGSVHDWMQYALALKTMGQQAPAVAAYRKAIELSPGFGAAWHALSNMKLAVFTPDDVGLMEQQLLRSDLEPEDRYNLHFTGTDIRREGQCITAKGRFDLDLLGDIHANDGQRADTTERCVIEFRPLEKFRQPVLA
jgi:tetratricopeptide (TPR) repeat protein